MKQAMRLPAGITPGVVYANTRAAHAAAGDGADGEALRLLGEIRDESLQLAQRLQVHDAQIMELERQGVRQMDAAEGRFGRGGGGDSMGRRAAMSSELADFRARGCKGTVTIKGAITTAATSGGAFVQPSRPIDPVMLPQQQVFLRGLLGSAESSVGRVEFPRQTGFTNNADIVSGEGTLKPESDMEFELADVTLKTIAHWIPASRQALEDAPLLASLIDGQLRWGLDYTEEQQLLFGDGLGSNIEGIIPQATDFDTNLANSGDNDLDLIARAILQSQQAKLPASGVILNIADWNRMMTMKDSEGRYLGAGPFGDQRPMMWGLPVVPSLAMTEGEFLVGAFKTGAAVVDHTEGTSVLFSTEDRDNFVKNMVTVLAERRVALAVMRPEAFVYGALSGS